MQALPGSWWGKAEQLGEIGLAGNTPLGWFKEKRGSSASRL